MTKTVYILTEEGRGYSTEGLEIITKNIREFFHDESELIFQTGQSLNRPSSLTKLLEANKDRSYLMVSSEKGLYYTKGSDYDPICQVLSEHDDAENAWAVLYGIMKKNQ